MSVALLLALLAVEGRAAPGAGVSVPAMPDRYVGEAASPEGAPAGGPWWDRFGDPGLDAVMTGALAGNLDLALAGERVRQAEAVALASLAPLLPRVSLDSTLTGQPAALRFAQFTGTTDEEVEGFYFFGSTTFNGTLQLDVTGRGVLGLQAARAEARAVEEDLGDLGLTLASRVAGAWFDVGLQQARLAVLEDQLTATRNLLEVVELRLGRGEATAVDVLQQRQQLAATEAQLPLVRAARTVATQQLAVLAGLPPARVPAALPDALPELPPPPPVGAPDDLLDHRPDVRAAELRLRSSWQRRLAAERAFLPSLAATAGAGWSYTNNAGAGLFRGGGGFDLAPLFGAFGQLEGFVRELDPAFPGFGLQPPVVVDPEPVGLQQWFAWNVGGQLSVPLLDVGVIANLRQARAVERQAAYALASQQLQAVAEVEAALAQDLEQRRRLEEVREQARAARLAFDAAVARYADGIGDYLTVLTTLVAWQNAQLQALQAHRDALAARVQLHEALGGPWTRTLREIR